MDHTKLKEPVTLEKSWKKWNWRVEKVKVKVKNRIQPLKQKLFFQLRRVCSIGLIGRMIAYSVKITDKYMLGIKTESMFKNCRASIRNKYINKYPTKDKRRNKSIDRLPQKRSGETHKCYQKCGWKWKHGKYDLSGTDAFFFSEISE